MHHIILNHLCKDHAPTVSPDAVVYAQPFILILHHRLAVSSIPPHVPFLFGGGKFYHQLAGSSHGFPQSLQGVSSNRNAGRCGLK